MPIHEPLTEDQKRNFAAWMIARAVVSEASMYLDDYRSRKGRLHTKKQCAETRKAGGPKKCVIHNPTTTHPLAGCRQILRSSGLIEDQCQHGVGHPNPDSVAFFDWKGWKGYDVHGCDGCCVGETRGQ
jgi:hypothetical protein